MFRLFSWFLCAVMWPIKFLSSKILHINSFYLKIKRTKKKNLLQVCGNDLIYFILHFFYKSFYGF